MSKRELAERLAVFILNQKRADSLLGPLVDPLDDGRHLARSLDPQVCPRLVLRDPQGPILNVVAFDLEYVGGSSLWRRIYLQALLGSVRVRWYWFNTFQFAHAHPRGRAMTHVNLEFSHGETEAAEMFEQGFRISRVW